MNKVINSNPYGVLDERMLVEFEKRLGATLSPSYRSYLLSFNGGDYEKKIIAINKKEGDTSIHHMYGLHSGPDYRRLSVSDVIDCADAKFIKICDDATGNNFCLKVSGNNIGGVYFLDHEIESNARCESLICVAKDFDDFVQNMKSNDDDMIEFKNKDPEGYNDFQQRLAEMKRLREEELKNQE